VSFYTDSGVWLAVVRGFALCCACMYVLQGTQTEGADHRQPSSEVWASGCCCQLKSLPPQTELQSESCCEEGTPQLIYSALLAI